MGSLLTSALTKLSSLFLHKTKILILGLDAAGKTTIVYQLKLKQSVNTIPTIGFNVETFVFKNLQVTLWDIPPNRNMKPIMKHYYAESSAVIFVLDSADVERYQIAREQFQSIASYDILRDLPFLILANKKDRASVPEAEIRKAMGLDQLKINAHVQKCCGLDGEGLYQGLQWLRGSLQNRKK